MPRSTRDALTNVFRLCRAPRRVRLSDQSAAAEHLYLLGSGRVRLEQTLPSGATTHVAHLGAGDFIGDLTLAGATSAQTAVVVEEALALVAPVSDLRELAVSDPALYPVLASMALQRALAWEDRLEALLMRKVEARLAWFVMYAAERWGAADEAGTVVGATICHHEIARMIGTGREWVTMTLIRLREQKILGAHGRRIVVRDAVRLRALAAGGSAG